MKSSWSPPKSPYNLIQEQFWDDPWKIFVACIFCNLTKRVQSEPYMRKFFNKFPNPKKASEACPKEIQKMIQPLGLSQRRSVALVKMSKEYLLKDWKETPEVLYGVGKYAADAYRIFCLGTWRSVKPKDGALVNYHEWLKSKENSEI